MDLITLATYSLYFIIPFLAFYLYATRNNNFWKNQGIPFIKPTPFLGHMGEAIIFKKLEFHEFDLKYYKKFGSIYGGFEASKPYLFVGDTEIIKNVFIKDFNVFPNRRLLKLNDDLADNMVSLITGEAWKRVRAAMSPAFSSGKMRKMSKLIDESALTTAANIEKATSLKSVDIKKICGAFTMDVIASTAFGTKIDSHNDPNNPFVQHAAKVFSQGLNLKFILLFIFPKLAKFLKGSFLQREATAFFKSVVEKLLEERRNENKENKRIDFLQLMIDAGEIEKQNQTDNKNDKVANKGISEIEILSQCVLFFMAGYETTASTISFVLYYMAQNPEIQDRVAKEVSSVLKETDGQLDYDIIKRMPFLSAVVSETLRLLPPGIRLERQADFDYEIKNPPIKIPKGTIIGVPVYAMHRDAKYFPNPETFDPERFLPENKDSINMDAYLPFGEGPRNCLAMRFALLEIKLCLARLIPIFRFTFSADTEIPLKFISSQGLLVPKSVHLKVDSRNSS